MSSLLFFFTFRHGYKNLCWLPGCHVSYEERYRGLMKWIISFIVRGVDCSLIFWFIDVCFNHWLNTDLVLNSCTIILERSVFSCFIITINRKIASHFSPQLFASWGIDMIKLDGCFSCADLFPEGHTAFGWYVNQTNREILYSCEWPVYLDDTKPKVWLQLN